MATAVVPGYRLSVEPERRSLGRRAVRRPGLPLDADDLSARARRHAECAGCRSRSGALHAARLARVPEAAARRGSRRRGATRWRRRRGALRARRQGGPARVLRRRRRGARRRLRVVRPPSSSSRRAAPSAELRVAAGALGACLSVRRDAAPPVGRRAAEPPRLRRAAGISLDAAAAAAGPPFDGGAPPRREGGQPAHAPGEAPARRAWRRRASRNARLGLAIAARRQPAALAPRTRALWRWRAFAGSEPWPSRGGADAAGRRDAAPNASAASSGAHRDVA